MKLELLSLVERKTMGIKTEIPFLSSKIINKFISIKLKSLYFLFFLNINYIFPQTINEYLKSEFVITNESELRSSLGIGVDDLKKGLFDIAFVGDANLQNSFNSGASVAANTGLGAILSRFWLEETSRLRQFELSININVASTLDQIEAKIQDDKVINKRDFGSFLLIPSSNKQSAQLESNIYFNNYKYGFPKYISGINLQFIGSKASWKYLIDEYNLATVNLKVGAFYEFVPDKIRLLNGYSIIVGCNLSNRWILGELNYSDEETKKAKKAFLDTDKKSFFAFEPFVRIKLRNIVAEVNMPLFTSKKEIVPGLTRSQFVTLIKFVGGFPLKLSQNNSIKSTPTILGI